MLTYNNLEREILFLLFLNLYCFDNYPLYMKVQHVVKKLYGTKTKKIYCVSCNEEILDQEVWKLAKRISTNKSYAEFIKKGQKRVEENRKKIIKNVIEELKTKNENITILKRRLLTGLPKNYLYSEEIENYIEELKQF